MHDPPGPDCCREVQERRLGTQRRMTAGQQNPQPTAG